MLELHHRHPHHHHHHHQLWICLFLFFFRGKVVAAMEGASLAKMMLKTLIIVNVGFLFVAFF
jgi:hypothetical protein